MNLIKNVDGSWDYSKGRVRQDFDTIQRTINQLQAALIALQTQVNNIPPPPPAVISSANTPTTFDSDFLRSVATVPLSGLTGKGTITDPLGFDGSVIVDVDPTGALDGDGTIGSPLAVRVDGVTISINGSNELEVAGGGGGVSVQEARITITNAQILTLGSVPVVLVPSPGPGFVTQVLWVSTQYIPDPVTFYTPGCSGDLYYSSGGVFTAGKGSWHLATVVPGSSFDGVFSLGQQSAGPFIIQGTQIGPANCDIVLSGGNNTLATGTTGSVVEVTIGYVTLVAL